MGLYKEWAVIQKKENGWDEPWKAVEGDYQIMEHFNDLGNDIRERIVESIQARENMLGDQMLLKGIQQAVDTIICTYRGGGKLLLCGNGGSAGDAQHIAGELVARFYLERKALPAIAFNTNSSVVTAIGNDYEYDVIFERQVEAYGKPGDALIAISTSGESESVFRAICKANELGVHTIGFLGKGGGRCRDICENAIVVPSDVTPRIQECHILIGHIICEFVERELAGSH